MPEPTWLHERRRGWQRSLPTLRPVILAALDAATRANTADRSAQERFGAARCFFNNYLDELHNSQTFVVHESEGHRWSAELKALSPPTRFTCALVAVRYAQQLRPELERREGMFSQIALQTHIQFSTALAWHILAADVDPPCEELGEFSNRIDHVGSHDPCDNVVLRFVALLERRFAHGAPPEVADIIRRTALRWRDADVDALWQPARRLGALVNLAPPPPIADPRYPDSWAFELLNRLACDLIEQRTHRVRLARMASGREILSLAPAQRAVIARCGAAVIATADPLQRPAQCPPQLKRAVLLRMAGALALTEILRGATSLSEHDQLEMLRCIRADVAIRDQYDTADYLTALTRRFEREARAGRLAHSVRTALAPLVDALRAYGNASVRKIRDRLRRLCDVATQFPLEGGEAWSDEARRHVESSPRLQTAWVDLLSHCASAWGGLPANRWSDTAETLVGRVGESEFCDAMAAWLPLVDKPRTQPLDVHGYPPIVGHWHIAGSNADILKGLAWCCGLGDRSSLARTVAALAVSAYRKLPGIGPRLVKVGNACLWALGNMPGTDGISQLAILKTRVKFGTAQKLIDKALTAAAQRLGFPRDEVEEMAVPAYGLEGVGRRRETFDDYTAELAIIGSTGVEIRWSKSDGKPLKSAPSSVKQNHADDVKELTQTARDIQKMLAAQRERIDALHLARKSWPIATWRARYLDHPLVGVVARRLIWVFRAGKRSTAAIHVGAGLVDISGKPFQPADSATVELWHPIGQSIDEIRAWRAFLEDRQIRQPFKQAHREIYLLTDAERRTRTYSNRFAAHVLRQHQFNALCAARGWNNKLRLLVDDTYPPATLALPRWDLRAEFWIEGIGDDYGRDTNESGVFLRIATDQVRFYRLNAAELRAHAGGGGYQSRAAGSGADRVNEPLPLEKIPPLVFSEVMRDADLFVGVASVGNDPTWQDGGPDGRFRDYWGQYAFGDLGETARTRRAVLETLVPRLKIAHRSSLTDKFLVVRGSLRTYKIHLGSSNILMEPNDQYLCIVPGRGAVRTADNTVHLPFEGDERLSVIISKALMLADDANITDPTITRQIRGT